MRRVRRKPAVNLGWVRDLGKRVDVVAMAAYSWVVFVLAGGLGARRAPCCGVDRAYGVSPVQRTVTARELHDSFTPSVGEIEWARELTRSAEHLLALVVLLKSFQRLGYFADLCEVPVVVVDHNDPEHLEKLVKFNELLANCMIYNTTVDLTNLVNELVADGHPVRRGDLATISPVHHVKDPALR
jgi:Tn3 transposase DDE domain/Domain of unknown function (DUF4158)